VDTDLGVHWVDFWADENQLGGGDESTSRELQFDLSFGT
jgi:hypothetical protein